MSSTDYDGLLQRPFLAEHWHKGVVASLVGWPLSFLGTLYVFPEAVSGAMVVATLVSITVLASVLTQYEGFALDLSARRYRRYTWVAGLRFGAWQPLPRIEQVKVRYVQKRHSLPLDQEPVGVGLVATERVWQVLLRVEQSPVGIVAANTKQENALRIAATLATLLQTEVLVQS
jgi:hypothetical protein